MPYNAPSLESADFASFRKLLNNALGACENRSMTTKKGPTKGSGGKHRNALRGKGPTPKAEDLSLIHI